MDVEGTSWGIEPVPERLRVLGFLDTLLLWGNLSVSLLVIVIGALLVPALSLRDALLAIIVGAIAGNLLLALAALIGADARVPGMVVLRAPLGKRGSYGPTFLNVAQLTVRAVVEGSRELVYRAAMLDPNTGATLTTSEIVAMVDDLIDAHGELIPDAIR